MIKNLITKEYEYDQDGSMHKIHQNNTCFECFHFSILEFQQKTSLFRYDLTSFQIDMSIKKYIV